MASNEYQQARILKNLGIRAQDVPGMSKEQRDRLQQMGVRLCPSIVQQVDALRNHDKDPLPDQPDGQ